MPAETTSKQNAVIWSATGFIIVLLCSIIGWLVIGKDTSLTVSIRDLVSSQKDYIAKAEESDRRIMEAFNKLCERVGNVEGRVGKLESDVRIPFLERQKYLYGTGK